MTTTSIAGDDGSAIEEDDRDETVEPTKVSRRAHAISLTLFIALAAVGVISSVVQFREVSVVDEPTHADYAYRLSHGELVARGDKLSQEILGEISCRGVYKDNYDFPSCGDTPYDPTDFRAEGYNYNAFHPPLYYAISAAGASTILAVTPVDSYLHAVRLTGIAWLAAGMFVSWLLFLELGVSVFAARWAAGAMGLLPAVMRLGSVANNDAAAILAGASLILVTIKFTKNKVPWWGVLLTAFCCALLKSIFITAAVFTFFYLAAHAFQNRRSREVWIRVLLVAVITPALFPITQIGWKAIQVERTSEPGYSSPLKNTGTPAEGIPFVAFSKTSLSFLPPTNAATPMPQIVPALAKPWRDLSDLLLAGAPFAVWLSSREGSRKRRFAWVTTAALIGGAVVVAAGFYQASGTVKSGLNPRYGLALLPAAMACVALLVDSSNGSRRTALVVSTIGIMTVLVSIWGLA